MRWATKETDLSFDDADDSGNFRNNHERYRTALLLASGLQMAGPNLTPESFARGLQRTVFPNPEHPINAGSVGFNDGDHSMTDDAAEYWWSQTDPSPYPKEGVGTICYVDHGARHRTGTWPSGGDPFFQRPCDSGAR